VPVEPQEPRAELGDATQPIQLADLPAELFDPRSIE